MGLAERVVQLEARLVELIAENEALRDRVARLEAELARDSNNSSKPPSADSENGVGPASCWSDPSTDWLRVLQGIRRPVGRRPRWRLLAVDVTS